MKPGELVPFMPDPFVPLLDDIAPLDSVALYLASVGCTCNYDVEEQQLENGMAHFKISHDECCPLIAKIEANSN